MLVVVIAFLAFVSGYRKHRETIVFLPDLPPVHLMDMGFAVICPLARHCRPLIR